MREEYGLRPDSLAGSWPGASKPPGAGGSPSQSLLGRESTLDIPVAQISCREPSRAHNGPHTGPHYTFYNETTASVERINSQDFSRVFFPT